MKATLKSSNKIPAQNIHPNKIPAHKIHPNKIPAQKNIRPNKTPAQIKYQFILSNLSSLCFYTPQKDAVPFTLMYCIKYITTLVE